MSTSDFNFKNLTHYSSSIRMLMHKDEIHKDVLWNSLFSFYSTAVLLTHFSKESPEVKTFRKVLQSSAIFYSGIFYKRLQYSIGKFFNIKESSGLFFFLLECSIYLSEKYTNLKHIEH